MSNVIEHLFCGYCKQECEAFEDKRNFCERCTSFWNQAEDMSNEVLSENLTIASLDLLDCKNDDYSGPLTKADQATYEDICMWSQILREEYDYRNKEQCSVCKVENATIEDMCTDCFWDDDSNQKRLRRANPRWRFNRIIHSGMVLFGRSQEEATEVAISTFKREGIPLPIY
jgi:predicted amidophosphoribosyltransferase